MKGFVRTGLGLAIGLVLAGTAAAKAGVEGRCSYEDKAFALVDGVAWTPAPEEEDDAEPEDWDGDGVPDDFDDWDGDGEPDPEPVKLAIAFTSFPLDVGALWRADDRDDALMDQAFADDGDASGKVVLQLEDGEVTMLGAWFSPGTSISRGGSDIGTLTPAPAASGPVKGRYRYVDEDDGFTCEATFEVPRLGAVADAPPPPGKPLPRGGGEPGAAYLALNRALLAGDADALAKLLPPDRAAQMQAARATPDFAAQMAMMQAMAPADVVVTGGRLDGDTAWLDFTATEGGQPRVGTAKLVKENGRWVMEEESTRDPE